LADIRAVFVNSTELPTKVLLQELMEIEESPWGDLRGKPLDERGLATRLRAYEIRSHQIRIGEKTLKGYRRQDFIDAWARYLASASSKRETSETNETISGAEPSIVSDVSAVSLVPGNETEQCAQCRGEIDGTERRYNVRGRAVWLHPQCRQFFEGKR
jgi:hypothetical protein